MKTYRLTTSVIGTLLVFGATGLANTVTLYDAMDVGISAGDNGTQNTGKAAGSYGTMAIDNRWSAGNGDYGRRALIAWDLSSIPAGATITSAQVNLLCSTSYDWTGLPASCYSVTSPWTEGYGMSNGSPGAGHVASGAGWWYSKIETLTSWTTSGGDYDVSSRVQMTGVKIPDSVTGQNFCLQPNGAGLVSIVQSWVSGTKPNYGLEFIFDAAKTDLNVHPVYSRDMGYNDDGQDRPAPGAYAPQLVITYTATAPHLATDTPSGPMDFGPQHFDFTTNTASASTQTTITLDNIAGDAGSTAHVAAAAITGSDAGMFSIDVTGAVGIAQGASQAYKVNFIGGSALYAHTYTATLTLSSSDGNGGVPVSYTYALSATTAGPHMGDVDMDGHVLLADFSILKANYNKNGYSTDPSDWTGWLAGDLDRDGSVILADFSLLKAHYNHSGDNVDSSVIAIPEPASLSLLALAGLALRRRNRR